MNKYLKLAGLMLCAVLCLAVSSGRVFARLAGTDPGSDVWCNGISGAEVCVDTSGNFIPTTDNDTTLGTSALRWATAYILDITVGDDLTVTDDLTVNGDSLLGDGAADEVGINEASPDASLEIASGDNVYVLRVSSQNGSTDLLTIASNGGELIQEGGVILNEGGAAVDLRVEGDNTANLLTVDGSADAVGIGSDATPDAVLEVTPRGADTYALRVSSANGSTDLLAVQVANNEIEMGIPHKPFQRTAAQLAALTPRIAGLVYACSDCAVPYALCISTGATIQGLMLVHNNAECK